MKKYLTIIGALGFFACNNDKNDPAVITTPEVKPAGIAAPQTLNAVLMAEYPHDTSAFTEGLFVYNGKMYEGTGYEKKTFIQITDIKTGKIDQKFKVKDSSIFGEGINVFKDKLYQLTYQNHIAYVYNLNDLSNPVKTFPWQTEGWGMTNNGTELIISDGGIAGNLYFVNPDDFKVKRIVQVVDNIGPVENVNELEYIDGFIYSNVWGTTYILKIDPSNGHVVGKLETADILKNFYSTYPIRQMDNVLNGIAYDSSSKKLFITGKKWPKIFELKMN